MQPTPKAPGIERFLADLMGDRHKAVARRHCTSCGVIDLDGGSFRDDRSRHEYRISGLCQGCQDDVFGTFDEVDGES